MIGAIRARQSITVPVSPGRHTLVVRIDWCGSEPADFIARFGDHASFECGSVLSGWRVLLALFYVTYSTRNYLWLRRVDDGGHGTSLSAGDGSGFSKGPHCGDC
jgi:hypothetical protein